MSEAAKVTASNPGGAHPFALNASSEVPMPPAAATVHSFLS